jgi:hypothetical protein
VAFPVFHQPRVAGDAGSSQHLWQIASKEVLKPMRTQIQRFGSRTNEGPGLGKDRWDQVVALDPDLAVVIGFCSIGLLLSLLLTLAVPLSSEAAAMFAQLT